MEVGQWEMARMVVNIALAASGRAGRGVVGAMLPHEAGIRITEFINMTALLASTKTKRANEAARAVPLGGTTRDSSGYMLSLPERQDTVQQQAKVPEAAPTVLLSSNMEPGKVIQEAGNHAYGSWRFQVVNEGHRLQ